MQVQYNFPTFYFVIPFRLNSTGHANFKILSLISERSKRKKSKSLLENERIKSKCGTGFNFSHQHLICCVLYHLDSNASMILLR